MLATVVGVLTEVPIMLSLCWIANNTSSWFPKLSAAQAVLADAAIALPAKDAATADKTPASEETDEGAKAEAQSVAARV